MRLFDTPGADGAYDKWFDPPSIHDAPSCNCDSCHLYHKEEGVENFYEACDSCYYMLENDESKGVFCFKHGYIWQEEPPCLKCQSK